jgi:hypothetical protein
MGRAIEGLLKFNQMISDDSLNSLITKVGAVLLTFMVLLLVNYLYITYGFKRDYVNAKVNIYKQTEAEKENFSKLLQDNQ